MIPQFPCSVCHKCIGDKEKYSSSYALMHLTETIKQYLDQGLFSCGIFVDLQKAFDTADHGILFGKLEHYGMRGITNKWLQFIMCISANWCSTRVCFESFTIPFVH